MMTGDPLEPGPSALADATAYLRAAGAEEDALVERLLVTAAELCEQFTGQTLLTRAFAEAIPASSSWTRLSRTPVVAITGLEALSADGVGAALAPGSFAVDIDVNGDGWVRVLGAAPGKVRVRYRAGLAADWAETPEPLRQGIIRLVAHLFTHRDAPEESGPPAAVAALWRPYRRMRIG